MTLIKRKIGIVINHRCNHIVFCLELFNRIESLFSYHREELFSFLIKNLFLNVSQNALKIFSFKIRIKITNNLVRADDKRREVVEKEKRPLNSKVISSSHLFTFFCSDARSGSNY